MSENFDPVGNIAEYLRQQNNTILCRWDGIDPPRPEQKFLRKADDEPVGQTPYYHSGQRRVIAADTGDERFEIAQVSPTMCLDRAGIFVCRTLLDRMRILDLETARQALDHRLPVTHLNPLGRIHHDKECQQQGNQVGKCHKPGLTADRLGRPSEPAPHHVGGLLKKR